MCIAPRQRKLETRPAILGAALWTSSGRGRRGQDWHMKPFKRGDGEPAENLLWPSAPERKSLEDRHPGSKVTMGKLPRSAEGDGGAARPSGRAEECFSGNDDGDRRSVNVLDDGAAAQTPE
jgi:hypothetical protein